MSNPFGFTTQYQSDPTHDWLKANNVRTVETELEKVTDMVLVNITFHSGRKLACRLPVETLIDRALNGPWQIGKFLLETWTEQAVVDSLR